VKSAADFARLGKAGDRPVALTWQLGAERRHSETSMFYEQAAAACRYLYFAEDGARRRALLEYVRAFYTGDAAGADVRTAFGVDAATLGARIVAYAGALARGEVAAPADE